MSFFVREKHAFDFSLTRIFITVFRTASAVVVTECQKLFILLPLPLRCQVHNRTASFMLRFMAIWQQRILFVMCLPYTPLEY